MIEAREGSSQRAAWRRPVSDVVAIEPVGEGLACYSVLSGETHILDAFPAEVYQCLPGTGVARAEDDIIELIAATLQEPPAAWQEQVVAALQRLERLSLVECVLP